MDAETVAFVRARSSLFKSTCLISVLEILALVSFFEDFAPDCAGQTFWVYMDSDNSFSAVAKENSDAESIDILVARTGSLLRRYNIRVGFSRVPSKIHPSDLPTRNRKLPYTARSSTSSKSRTKLFRLVSSALRKGHSVPNSRPRQLHVDQRHRYTSRRRPTAEILKTHHLPDPVWGKETFYRSAFRFGKFRIAPVQMRVGPILLRS